jgi:hypothetical protein
VQDKVRGSYADTLVLGSAVHMLVHWQLRRMRTAVAELQAACARVLVRDLAHPIAKCAAACVALEQAVQRLAQVRALATVLDAVDSLCMASAAVVAVADRRAALAGLHAGSKAQQLVRASMHRPHAQSAPAHICVVRMVSCQARAELAEC